MSGSAQSRIIIDNDRVIVTEYRFKPGDNTGWHTHAHDYVIVPQTNGQVKLETPNGPATAEMRKGEPYFRKAGVEHDVINAGNEELIFLEIEMK
jgi:beta-alanine degradation protein BauB